MTGIRWERWAPASGIVYVLLFVVAFIVVPGDIGDTDEEILAYYADSGNRAREIAAFFLIAVAALFLLWFVSTLRNRLRSVEPEPKSLSALAFGAGVASAALLVAALSLFVSVSLTIEDSDQFAVDPNLARVLENAGFLLFTGSTMVASVLVAATSVLALRTRVLPRWLGWVGLPVALVLLVAIFFFPLFVLWAWILVVSVLLIARTPAWPPQEREPEATGAGRPVS